MKILVPAISGVDNSFFVDVTARPRSAKELRTGFVVRAKETLKTVKKEIIGIVFGLLL